MIETRLLRCLHTLRVNPDSFVVDGRPLDEEICSLLEYYICGCIAFGPSSLRGWWSDGIIDLEITSPSSDRFLLLGVTWIDSLGIAPFEIDIERDPLDDIYFKKTIFRLGMLDQKGNPFVCNANLSPKQVIEMRPRYNRDWAMAFELTPPT